MVTVENEPTTAISELAEWCSAHGVSHCLLCNPELAQLDSVPEIEPQELARVQLALSLPGRATNSQTCSLVHHRLRLDSMDDAERLGIEIAPAWHGEMTEAIVASGETSFDPTRVAHLTSRAPGSAWRVLKRLGQSVNKGDVVALIESGEIGKSKAELQNSLVLWRLKTQAYDNAQRAPVSDQQKREAQAALRDAEVRVLSAEQALINFGLNVSAADLAELSLDAIAQKLQRLGLPKEFAEVDDDSIPGTLLPIVSPLDGIVTQMDLIAGEVVTPSRTLFTIGDARRLVLTLNVSPAQSTLVSVGQDVRFRPDGSARDALTHVSWIASAAKERTRTVPVRAELDNKDGRLFASAFGMGSIILRSEPNAVLVPNEAVQSDGECQLIFVRDKDFLKPNGRKIFHVRTVRTGGRDERNTEIIVGVLAGEVVAAKGSNFLLNELRRNQNTQIAAGRRASSQTFQTTRQLGAENGFRAK